MSLAALPNLGPAGARLLAGAGITTVAQLRREAGLEETATPRRRR